MKYLMLVYGNETIWNSLDGEAFAALVAAVDAYNEELRRSGELVTVEGLVTDPRSVRRAAAGPVVTDGPYLEAKEFVGSLFLVDVADEARALEIARNYPGLRFEGGGLEVWPVMSPSGSDM